MKVSRESAARGSGTGRAPPFPAGNRSTPGRNRTHNLLIWKPLTPRPASRSETVRVGLSWTRAKEPRTPLPRNRSRVGQSRSESDRVDIRFLRAATLVDGSGVEVVNGGGCEGGMDGSRGGQRRLRLATPSNAIRWRVQDRICRIGHLSRSRSGSAKLAGPMPMWPHGRGLLQVLQPQSIAPRLF